MPIQLSQSDLDAKRVLVKDAVVAYHQALRTYKDEMGSLPAHLDRTDNPHGLTKAQIGLGNVPNAAPATVQQSLDGFLSNTLSVPAGTAAQVEDRLSALQLTGQKTFPRTMDITSIAAGFHRRVVYEPTTVTVALSADQRTEVVVHQGATAHALTWPSSIRWVLTENNWVWSHTEAESWNSETFGQYPDNYTAVYHVDKLNNGEYNRRTYEFKNASYTYNGSEFVVSVERRTATISPPAFDIPYGRWLVELWNTGGHTYGKTTYLGREVNDTTRSQTPHNTDDRQVTAPEHVDGGTSYIARLQPGGPVEYTNAQFTRDVLNALGWSDASIVDPELVSWEIFTSLDGKAFYVPTRPLYDAVSFEALRQRGLLYGNKVITLPTRGSFLSNEWYQPTHHASFRVATPDNYFPSTPIASNRFQSEAIPPIAWRQQSILSKTLMMLLSPSEQSVITDPSFATSVATYTRSELGVDRGVFEWGGVCNTAGTKALASNAIEQRQWLPINTLAAWRPILIPEYETTLD